LAGRLVSVVAGFFSLLGMFLLGWEVSKNKKVGFICTLFYLVTPFFLVYDRLALMDSLLASFAIWSLYLTILLIRTLRLDVALILGMVIGGGLLTKSSANFFLYLIPVSLILFPWKKKGKWLLFGRWLGLVLIVVFISQLINNAQRLSPFYYIVALKNKNFIIGFSEFWQQPFRLFLGNLRGLTTWLVGYLTLPTSLLMVISSLWAIKKNFKLSTLLLFWFIIPFLGLAAFGKIIYPRFILFMIPPIILLAAQFLSEVGELVKSKILKIVFLFLLFAPSIYFDLRLLTAPVLAPYPLADRQQFLNDWPSGFGVWEAVAYFKEESKKGKIFIATEGTFGLFPAAFELYLGRDKNITIKGYWPLSEISSEFLKEAKTQPTYVVFKEKQEIPTSWPLNLVLEVRRGNGPTFLRVYKVVP